MDSKIDHFVKRAKTACAQRPLALKDLLAKQVNHLPPHLSIFHNDTLRLGIAIINRVAETCHCP